MEDVISPQVIESIETKKALRLLNLNADHTRPDSSYFAKLDGSIKKNTSFIKKVKGGITAQVVEGLKKEVLCLKMEKYLEEIACSIAETTLKTTSDIWAAVELVSLIHANYKGFDQMVLNELKKSFDQYNQFCEPDSKEESNRIVKQKSSLRFLIELYFVGLAQDGVKEKDWFIPSLLAQLFANDKRHQNVSLASTFSKFYAAYYIPTEICLQQNCTEEYLALRRDLCPEPIRQKCYKYITIYHKTVANRLVKEHDKLLRMETSAQDSFINRGEVIESRSEEVEKQQKYVDKLMSFAQQLSTYSFLEMPELKKRQEQVILTIAISENQGKQDTSDGIWDDDESKAFYTNILDLVNQVPMVLLQSKPGSLESLESEPKEQSDDMAPLSLDGEIIVENLEKDILKESVEDDQVETSGLDPNTGPSGYKVKLQDIFNRLLNASHRDTVDQLCIEFAFLGKKVARRQLAYHLLSVPRHRPDLLPCYSRVIAILNPYMPEIGQWLEKSFHYHFKKKKQGMIEEKLKNIRFIGELVKFRITPNLMVFHFIKLLLEDFNFDNIEIFCALLESCGRFLYCTTETHATLVHFLEILGRKKVAGNFDTKYVFMIENAIYVCNPPSASVGPVKVREPIELFLRKLIYKDLKRSNIEMVLKCVRKVNWNDAFVKKVLQKLFFKIYKVKYSNLHLMAFMLSELSRFYPDFGISVVDNTLECIRVGLEHNLFKNNQKRIAYCKFLGELYNYRMVDSNVVFETLYLLLRFGHLNGIPMPQQTSHLDAKNDFFRLRLACTILDTCGTCFKKGPLEKKMDQFLIFFQMYIYTKDPLSMDADFFIRETMDLIRPGFTFLPSYQECVLQLNAISLEQSNVMDDQSDEEVRDVEKDIDEEESSSVKDVSIEEEISPIIEQEDEEAIVHVHHHEQLDEEDDRVFEREFSRLMQESIDSRRTDRKAAVFDAPIPTRKHQHETKDETKVQFTLLQKRGNKQATKSIELPADTLFAQQTLSKQQAELKERVKMKKLVLDYEKNHRDDDTVGMDEIFDSKYRERLNKKPGWRINSSEPLDEL